MWVALSPSIVGIPTQTLQLETLMQCGHAGTSAVLRSDVTTTQVTISAAARVVETQSKLGECAAATQCGAVSDAVRLRRGSMPITLGREDGTLLPQRAARVCDLGVLVAQSIRHTKWAAILVRGC
jgi:hypothetical protein